MKDVLSKDIIKSVLKSNMNVTVFDTVGSTNTVAKELVLSGAALPFMVLANEQTNGRGRQGKSFYSPKDNGLYMTVALKIDAENPTKITAAAAIAAANAIISLTALQVKIKWVNDIYLENKKVGGILTEAVRDPESNRLLGIIVGIGVNMQACDLPKDLKDIAAALCDSSLTRNRLAAEITNNIIKLSSTLQSPELLEEYRRLSLVLGQNITFVKNGVSYNAKATDIDENGGLEVIRSDGKKETLLGGEITLRLHK